MPEEKPNPYAAITPMLMCGTHEYGNVVLLWPNPFDGACCICKVLDDDEHDFVSVEWSQLRPFIPQREIDQDVLSVLMDPWQNLRLKVERAAKEHGDIKWRPFYGDQTPAIREILKEDTWNS